MDGKALAERIRGEIAEEVRELGEIGLATVLVGDDPASDIYIRLKHKAAGEVGINAKDIRLASQTTEEELLEQVAQLNADDVDRRPPRPAPAARPHRRGARDPRDRPGRRTSTGSIRSTSASSCWAGPRTSARRPSGSCACSRSTTCRSRAPARSSSGAATSSASRRRCFSCTRTRPSRSAIRGRRDLGAVTREADVLVVAVGQAGVIGPDDVQRGRDGDRRRHEPRRRRRRRRRRPARRPSARA